MPATGLTPSFNSLVDIQTGDVIDPVPAIEEIGGGWYRIISNITYPTHYLGVVDAGDTINDPGERYIPINMRFSDFDLDNKEVYATNVYDQNSDSVTFLAYLLVNGRIEVSSVAQVTVAVYDANHTLLFSLVTTSITNGMAVLIKNSPGFVANRSYYMIVTIATGNELIASADTFIVIQ